MTMYLYMLFQKLIFVLSFEFTSLVYLYSETHKTVAKENDITLIYHLYFMFYQTEN